MREVFSDAQKEAVTWGQGPLLVIAGPGSGKTFVITHRVRYLMETLGDVDGDIVDAVLHGALAQGGKEVGHLSAVVVGDLLGLNFQLAAALEVDELIRAGVVGEVEFVCAVEGVEEDDFVLVVTQMAEGVEERLALFVAHEGVGEEDDEGAAVELLGEEVEGLGNGELRIEN